MISIQSIAKRLISALIAILLALIAYTHTANASRNYTVLVPMVMDTCDETDYQGNILLPGACGLVVPDPAAP